MSNRTARLVEEGARLEQERSSIPRDLLLAELVVLEQDERLTRYRTASCFSNVVLALHQCSGRARIDLLRKLLGFPPFSYPKGDPQ